MEVSNSKWNNKIRMLISAKLIVAVKYKDFKAYKTALMIKQL